MYGDELLASTRRDTYRDGNQYADRSIYHFDIPGLLLADVSGNKEALKNIVKQYPINAMSDANESLARQIARGASSAGSDDAGHTFWRGITTLNGIQDYYPRGNTRDGVFQAAAKGSQTNTVFGLEMSGGATDPTTGWYHQYGSISSFSVNGLEVMRKVRGDANREGGKGRKGIDLVLGDPQSFHNYQNELGTFVETVTVTDDHIGADIREGIKFGKADFFPEDAIDISDTTAFSDAAWQAGVMYLLASEDWDGFRMGNDDKLETKGLFHMREVGRVPNQELFRWELVNDWNIFCRQLRTQGLILGGATQ